ncbi:MAG: hypothetical protein ACOVKL_00135 [Polynucleobacter sp.]
MTDRELLELAAKAAGYTTIQYQNLKDSSLDIRYGIDEAIWNGEDYWNPLENDGTALRLAVKLEMFLDLTIAMSKNADVDANTSTEDCNNDPYAATRRAIVRAAAKIGKGIEVTK